MSKVKEYINETVEEMVHRVTWPTCKELQASTIIVVIASIIISLLIFAMDFYLEYRVTVVPFGEVFLVLSITCFN